MTSRPKHVIPSRWLARLLVAPAFIGGIAWAGSFGHLSDPSCEAGCAPVIDEASLGCGATGCDDVPCDATNDSCCTRETLLGDCGLRNGLAESGVTVYFDVTQVYQGVAAGGLQQSWDYGGHSDLLLNFDFGKMGGPKGLFLKVRGEGNFGDAIGSEAGTFLPPAIVAQSPVAEERNYAVTNFLITQALSESFAVFLGKNDTLDGDANVFASGRGTTQFLNSAMVFNPVAVRTVPYSTYMAGFAILAEGEPILNVSVLDPVDRALEGPDELFSQGATIASELRVPTRFFNLPGHQLVGGSWSSRDVVSLEQDPRVLFPLFGLPGTPVGRGDDSWSVYWNMDQHLVVDPEDETRGWGFFARYGAADQATNPLAHFASAGLGGSSVLPTRKADSWGVGYFYAWVSDSFVTNLAGVDDAQGVEAYYCAMVTPYFDITPDVQVLDGSLPADDDWALVLGMRANLRF